MSTKQNKWIAPFISIFSFILLLSLSGCSNSKQTTMKHLSDSLKSGLQTASGEALSAATSATLSAASGAVLFSTTGTPVAASAQTIYSKLTEHGPMNSVSLHAATSDTMTVVTSGHSLLSPSRKTAGKELPVVIEPANTYNLANYVTFSLNRVYTADTIWASMGDEYYYENETKGETYIDCVLDVKNISTKEIYVTDLLKVFAVDRKQKRYNCTWYTRETEAHTRLSSFSSIPAGTSARIHCALSVPARQMKYVINFKIDGHTYTMNYKLGNSPDSIISVKNGKINEEAFARVKLNKTFYAQMLQAPKEVDGQILSFFPMSKQNIFLIAELSVTNLTDLPRTASSMINASVCYEGNYHKRYNGFSVSLDPNQKGFDAVLLEPGKKRTVYILIEVPSTLRGKKKSITFSLHEKDYTFQ